VTSLVREELTPSIVFRNLIQPLRPVDHQITPLKERDYLINGLPVFQMVNVYHFNLTKTTDIQLSFSMLSDVLYESEYISQLYMVYNSNREYMGAGDAYPHQYPMKLEKGEYHVKLQVKHESRDMLTRLRDSCLSLNHKLTSPVTMDVYARHRDALTGGTKFNTAIAIPRFSIPFYVAPLPEERIPKGALAGFYLSGSLSLSKSEVVKKAEMNQPKRSNGYKDVYVVNYVLADPAGKGKARTASTLAASSSPSSSSRKSSSTATSSSASTTSTTSSAVTSSSTVIKKPEIKMTEEMRDLKISWITNYQRFDLIDVLRAEWPDHIPLYTTAMSAIDTNKNRDEKLDVLIELADEVIKRIDHTEMMANLSKKHDAKSQIKIETDKHKTEFIQALTTKGRALAIQIQQENEKHGAEEPQETATVDASITEKTIALKAIYEELFKTVDPKDTSTPVQGFLFKFAEVTGHNGLALKAAYRLYEDKNDKEAMQRVVKCCEMLGWNHVADSESDGGFLCSKMMSRDYLPF